MSDIAIHVDGISKRYRIGPSEPYHRFSEVLQTLGRQAINLPRRAASRMQVRTDANAARPSTRSNEYWALRDVSFEVKQGEVIGIIGRNGAGKSTLLKILSRITEPTSGRFGLRGRVASLLEVGTGFHPELTGRENIFLSGTLLGMTRQEIKRSFDEIVDFAEIEDFLDTPVKRYSSGMYVRLGFAIAAHLQPEILIVDEVLAVGDAQFQKKCLGKMGEVAAGGRTVVLVSHNMAAVLGLCSICVLLDGGHVKAVGRTADVASAYLRGTSARTRISLADREDRSGTGELRMTQCDIASPEGGSAVTGEALTLAIRYETAVTSGLKNLTAAAIIVNEFDQRLFTLATLFRDGPFLIAPSSGTLSCRITKLPLLPGRYRVHLRCGLSGTIADYVESAINFEVVPSDYFGNSRLPNAHDHGPFVVDHQWTLEPAGAG